MRDPNQLAGGVVRVLGRGIHGVGRGAVAREALIVGLPPQRVREVGVLVAERIYHRRLLVAGRVARDDVAGRHVAHRRDVRGWVGDGEHAVDHVARLARAWLGDIWGGEGSAARHAGVGRHEVGVAFEIQVAGLVIPGEVDHVLAAGAGLARLHQATETVVEGARDHRCRIVEALRLIQLDAGRLCAGRRTPDGVAPARRAQTCRLARQCLARHPAQGIVAVGRHLPIEIRGARGPEAEAARRRRRVARRRRLVQRVRAARRQRLERSVERIARGVLRPVVGAAGVARDARVGVRVVRGERVAPVVEHAGRAQLAAEREAVGRGAAAGIGVARRLVPQRQRALLADGVGRAVVARLAARVVDGIAAVARVDLRREVDQIPPRGARQRGRDRVVLDVVGVGNDGRRAAGCAPAPVAVDGLIHDAVEAIVGVGRRCVRAARLRRAV